MQYTSVGISLDYRYAIIHFNNAQGVRACFAAIETKIANKGKPIIQQFGFSEGKSEVWTIHGVLPMLLLLVSIFAHFDKMLNIG